MILSGLVTEIYCCDQMDEIDWTENGIVLFKTMIMNIVEKLERFLENTR